MMLNQWGNISLNFYLPTPFSTAVVSTQLPPLLRCHCICLLSCFITSNGKYLPSTVVTVSVYCIMHFLIRYCIQYNILAEIFLIELNIILLLVFHHMCSMFSSKESPFSDYNVGEQKLGEVNLVCWMPVDSMKIGVWKVAMSYILEFFTPMGNSRTSWPHTPFSHNFLLSTVNQLFNKLV